MSTSKIGAEIAALRAAALDDLLATTDAELRQEALEDGENLDAIALQVKSVMREVGAKALRQRMAKAKARMRPAAAARPMPAVRPSLDQIKQMVQALFQSDRSLGLAFRDGKQQTESDWQSLYDDLLAMGAIMPSDDEL